MLGRTLRSRVAAVSQVRLYHENIVEHYENPRNVGSFDKNDENVGTVGALQKLSKICSRSTRSCDLLCVNETNMACHKREDFLLSWRGCLS